MGKDTTSKGRAFTVELTSKSYLKNINLTNDSRGRVLLEGNIGELVQAGFEEGVLLEVVGKEGVIRVDLKDGEIKKKRSEVDNS
jgi:hypothetical protein